MNYTALKAELENDPNAYGYAPYWTTGTGWKLVEMLNTPRAAIRIDRDIVPAHEVYEAIVPSEWAALTADNKLLVQTMLGMGDINAKGTNTRLSFAAAFGAGTQTRANLVALQKRDGSRAEQLFGTAVTIEDVAAAYKA